jgi:hypothetical protein
VAVAGVERLLDDVQGARKQASDAVERSLPEL